MIRQLLANKESCVEIVSVLLKELNVKVTNTTIENELYNHPDYPSLLSIHDILSNYSIESVSFKAEISELNQLPTPFLAQIKTEKDNADVFTVVRYSDNNSVKYFDSDNHRWKEISVQEFENLWTTKIVLVPDDENKKDEEGFSQKKYNETRLRLFVWLLMLALPILTLCLCVSAFLYYGISSLYAQLFLLTELAGSIIGSLLFWYEIDRYNPVLQQICSGGKKVNCNAVLNSKASKIAGISWSSIGFVYFTGSLFLLLNQGLTNQTALFVLSWINVLSLPYVFFSVYYQWQVARQWCVLCLTVQALLVFQFFIGSAGGWHRVSDVHSVTSIDFLFPFAFAYLVPAIIVPLMIPAWQKAKENRRNKAELQRLKHNPQVFEALLAKQRTIKETPKGLGITLGNPYASYKITKVCNPYCGPCAKAHVPIDELLKNNPDIQVQIIFTATNADDDIKAAPVKHLLAIAENGDEAKLIHALDDWYLAENKDYNVFAAKYPMNGELKKQSDKIDAMSSWCEKTEISFTPTFFVNGNELPEMYNANDLKYFLSV